MDQEKTISKWECGNGRRFTVQEYYEGTVEPADRYWRRAFKLQKYAGYAGELCENAAPCAGRG